MTGLADMEKSLFGIVIQVTNLDLCRAFYRDVLGLGSPVMDSTFWVEFRLETGGSLFLEKSEVLSATEKGGRISWILRIDNPEELKSVLASYGYAVEITSSMRTMRLPRIRSVFPCIVFTTRRGIRFLLLRKRMNQ